MEWGLAPPPPRKCWVSQYKLHVSVLVYSQHGKIRVEHAFSLTGSSLSPLGSILDIAAHLFTFQSQLLLDQKILQWIGKIVSIWSTSESSCFHILHFNHLSISTNSIYEMDGNMASIWNVSENNFCAGGYFERCNLTGFCKMFSGK